MDSEIDGMVWTMKKHSNSKSELLESVVAVHTATTAILVALTKTLEQAGVMNAGHFEANVRACAVEMSERSKAVARLIEDFADQFQGPEVENETEAS